MDKYKGYKPAAFDEHNQEAARRFFSPPLIALAVIGVAVFGLFVLKVVLFGWEHLP
jgi:hypothetical protein